jgi:diadenosine tetraphosphate (Ap4A) HIT family hydrolase
MGVDCYFCQKLQTLDALPADELVCSLSQSVVLLAPWQYFHGYCILVAKQHASELSQLDDGRRRDLLDEMCLVARVIEEAFAPQKMNYELLGNQTPHLHWHLIPRFAGDGDPLNPIWFALERAKTDALERQRLLAGPLARATTADILRDRLRSAAQPRS